MKPWNGSDLARCAALRDRRYPSGNAHSDALAVMPVTLRPYAKSSLSLSAFSSCGLSSEFFSSFSAYSRSFVSVFSSSIASSMPSVITPMKSEMMTYAVRASTRREDSRRDRVRLGRAQYTAGTRRRSRAARSARRTSGTGGPCLGAARSPKTVTSCAEPLLNAYSPPLPVAAVVVDVVGELPRRGVAMRRRGSRRRPCWCAGSFSLNMVTPSTANM